MSDLPDIKVDGHVIGKIESWQPSQNKKYPDVVTLKAIVPPNPIDFINMVIDLSPWHDAIEFNHDCSNKITFHFWERGNDVKFRERAIIKTRKGKEFKACDLLEGDIIKNAKGVWDKIVRIER
jgi:hypothetical protein